MKTKIEGNGDYLTLSAANWTRFNRYLDLSDYGGYDFNLDILISDFDSNRFDRLVHFLETECAQLVMEPEVRDTYDLFKYIIKELKPYA